MIWHLSFRPYYLYNQTLGISIFMNKVQTNVILYLQAPFSKDSVELPTTHQKQHGYVHFYNAKYHSKLKKFQCIHTCWFQNSLEWFFLNILRFFKNPFQVVISSDLTRYPCILGMVWTLDPNILFGVFVS